MKSKAFRAFLLLTVLSVFMFSSCMQNEAASVSESRPVLQPVVYPIEESMLPTPAPATPAPLATPSPTQPPQYVSLLFAGDIMVHQKQIDSHKFGSSYDFTGDYEYIKDIVSAADIAVANLETPITGDVPEGWPHFNAPESLADALLYAGFDILATANNHIRDQYNDGIIRTNRTLREKGFGVIGTDCGEGGNKYALIEKNGIRLGFVNFTVSLNKGYPESAVPYVNCLRSDHGMESGYLALEGEIASLKELGAEFIVVFMHWGSEYQLQANATQESMAKRIADSGADLIIGSHPHVLQNVAEYASPVTGKNVLIYYSLGNLVSNQTYSYGPGRGHCETGALALIRLKRQEDGSVAVDTAGYLTTYVHKPDVVREYTVNGETRRRRVREYDIVPAATALADPSSFEGAEGVLSRIEQAVKNGRRIVGESGAELALFDFREYTAPDW